MLSLIVIVVIILFKIFIGDNHTFLRNEPNNSIGAGTNLEEREVDAIVTFSTDGRHDFLVEDARGRKAGYNPLTDEEFREIEGAYVQEFWPWQRIEEDGGTRIFETKVFNDYNFKITVYGKPGETFSFIHDMRGGENGEFAESEVIENAKFDALGISEFEFSYDF